MKKIFIIIKREYLTRVRKRSFIIMTILGPILMAALFIVPVYIAEKTDEVKTIGVVDQTGLFFNKFHDSDNLKFKYIFSDIQEIKNNFSKSNFYAVLYIPKTKLNVPTTGILYSNKNPNINVQSYIKNTMEKEIEGLKLKASGINENILRSVKTKIHLSTIKINKGGKEEKSNTELSMTLGFVGGFLIYIFIFMYGSQVMRGVIEEKTSRIVEVIISSVKPFQLMMGKIIGVALVGLTQFLLWIVLTFSIIGVFKTYYHSQFNINKTEQVFLGDNKLSPDSQEMQNKNNAVDIKNADINSALKAFNSIDFGVIISSFLFFFVGGYLLYAALFAAIGSAVDSEADTQQFMMPITIPLILAIVMSQFIINNPDGPVAFWFSIIPFTSPIIMMIRIPFGVPYFDLILSIVLLIIGFLITTWLAAKIYRTGILMYGKKVNYKELWKWIKYKS